jgi:hypothetical protein
LTHAYLGLIAFDLVLTLAGYAVLFCLGLLRRGLDAFRYLGLAFLAGWATVGLTMGLGATVGVDPDLGEVLGGAAILIAISVAVGRRVPALPRAARRPERSRLAVTTALAGGATVVLSLGVALSEAIRANADMTWDAWQFWVPKAEAIYYFHGLDTGLSGFTTYGNPEYPPLVPVLNAASFHFTGGVYPMLLPLQQCLLLVAFIASVAALVRRAPGWILFPSLALIVLAPQVWGEMFSVLPDQTLAYLLGVAAVAGILWLDERRGAWLCLAVVFLAAAALTKSEGVLLGLLLALVVVGAGFVLRGRRAVAGLALLLGPLALAPWKLWLAHHHQPTSATVYSWTDLLHPVYLADRFDRLTYATGHMVDLLADSNRWSPILPLTLAALIVLAPILRVLSAALAVWLIVAFLGLATVYWIGTPDVQWYVATSAYRVVTNLPIVAGAVLPLLLGIALERERAANESPWPHASSQVTL